MKLIRPCAEKIIESNPYKLVELVGRTCYKSESNITEDSCYDFVSRLIKRKHLAMLEHARITFFLSFEDDNSRSRFSFAEMCKNIPEVYISNHVEYHKSLGHIINVSLSHLYNNQWDTYAAYQLFPILRAIIEKHYSITLSTTPYSIENFQYMYSIADIEIVDDIDEVLYVVNPQLFKFETLKFTCDRGVSHELVRHRCAVAQESTRYCDYSKDKFGGELTFIPPDEYYTWIPGKQKDFQEFLTTCEHRYLYEISKGKLTPQIARGFLPHFLKTEVILTMNLDRWKHFFNLRLFGTTGAPHPDMKVAAGLGYKAMYAE